MKFKDKIVSLCAPLAVLVIVTAALLHFKPAVGILRLVIACVSLYGGLTLLGSAVERVWAANLRFAKRRQVKYPRTATGVFVVLMLVLIEILIMVAVKMHEGRMVAGFIASGFLLVGGSLFVGKWLSLGWDISCKLLGKDPMPGDEIK